MDLELIRSCIPCSWKKEKFTLKNLKSKQRYENCQIWKNYCFQVNGIEWATVKYIELGQYQTIEVKYFIFVKETFSNNFNFYIRNDNCFCLKSKKEWYYCNLHLKIYSTSALGFKWNPPPFVECWYRAIYRISKISDKVHARISARPEVELRFCPCSWCSIIAQVALSSSCLCLFWWSMSKRKLSSDQ